MENITTDLTQFTSVTFLKVGDVKDGDKLTILSSTKKETNKWGKEVLTFFVTHNGINKLASINTRSPQIERLVAILGLNPISWIGKTVTCKKVAVTLADGKAVQALEFSK